MSQTIRHGFFILLAGAALVVTWPHAFDWMRDGGNILNLPSFFIDSYRSGSAAAFLTIDIAVAWLVFMIWVVVDARQIGLGARWGWTFVLLSVLGTCFAFPLYLVLRERYVQRLATAD
jgi:hypothetical protein